MKIKIKYPKLTYKKKLTLLQKTLIGGFLIAFSVALMLIFMGVLDRFEKPLSEEEKDFKMILLKINLENEIVNSYNYKILGGRNLNLIDVVDERDRCKKEHCYIFRFIYNIDNEAHNLKKDLMTVEFFISDFIESVEILNK